MKPALNHESTVVHWVKAVAVEEPKVAEQLPAEPEDALEIGPDHLTVSLPDFCVFEASFADLEDSLCAAEEIGLKQPMVQHPNRCRSRPKLNRSARPGRAGWVGPNANASCTEDNNPWSSCFCAHIGTAMVSPRSSPFRGEAGEEIRGPESDGARGLDSGATAGQPTTAGVPSGARTKGIEHELAASSRVDAAQCPL